MLRLKYHDWTRFFQLIKQKHLCTYACMTSLNKKELLIEKDYYGYWSFLTSGFTFTKCNLMKSFKGLPDVESWSTLNLFPFSIHHPFQYAEWIWHSYLHLHFRYTHMSTERTMLKVSLINITISITLKHSVLYLWIYFSLSTKLWLPLVSFSVGISILRQMGATEASKKKSHIGNAINESRILMWVYE